MSKAVLISIKSEWCDFIKLGMKTVEVRKSRPRLDTPFKVYIYCTIHGGSFLVGGKHPLSGNGMVVGEFICNKVETLSPNQVFDADAVFHSTCLTSKQIIEYSDKKALYFWHISDLKIYDRPKELREFRVPCAEYERDNPRCGNCRYYYSESNEAIEFYDECSCDGLKYIERAPQSWCYVEEREDNG